MRRIKFLLALGMLVLLSCRFEDEPGTPGAFMNPEVGIQHQVVIPSVDALKDHIDRVGLSNKSVSLRLLAIILSDEKIHKKVRATCLDQSKDIDLEACLSEVQEQLEDIELVTRSGL